MKVNREPGSAPDRVVLSIALEEQSTGELSFAIGYSTAEGVIGDITYTERNLMETGQFLQVKLSGSQVSGGIDVSWTEPRFLDRNLSFGVDLFVRNSDYTQSAGYTVAGYADFKAGGSVRLGFALLDNLWLTTNYTAYFEDVYNVDANASLAVKQIAGPSVVSSVGYSLIYDTRNNRKNPTRGFYFSFAQDFAGLGGDVDYVRSVAEARAYYPLTSYLTLVGRGIGGTIQGWNSQDVRIVDDFFKGGETVRGFAPGGLGARDIASGDSLGGKTFYAGTVEVRFPLPFIPDDLGFGGAIFADAGSLYGTDANKFAAAYIRKNPGAGALYQGIENNDDTLRTSVGASILWNSPIGPLRADFAYVINKEAYDQTQFFKFGAATKF